MKASKVGILALCIGVLHGANSFAEDAPLANAGEQSLKTTRVSWDQVYDAATGDTLWHELEIGPARLSDMLPGKWLRIGKLVARSGGDIANLAKDQATAESASKTDEISLNPEQQKMRKNSGALTNATKDKSSSHPGHKEAVGTQRADAWADESVRAWAKMVKDKTIRIEKATSEPRASQDIATKMGRSEGVAEWTRILREYIRVGCVFPLEDIPEDHWAELVRSGKGYYWVWQDKQGSHHADVLAIHISKEYWQKYAPSWKKDLWQDAFAAEISPAMKRVLQANTQTSEYWQKQMDIEYLRLQKRKNQEQFDELVNKLEKGKLKIYWINRIDSKREPGVFLRYYRPLHRQVVDGQVSYEQVFSWAERSVRRETLFELATRITSDGKGGIIVNVVVFYRPEDNPLQHHPLGRINKA